jgi:hypothetical protein
MCFLAVEDFSIENFLLLKRSKVPWTTAQNKVLAISFSGK